MDGKIYNGIDNQIDLAPGDKEWLKAVLRPLEESAIHAGQEEFKTVLHEEAIIRSRRTPSFSYGRKSIGLNVNCARLWSAANDMCGLSILFVKVIW